MSKIFVTGGAGFIGSALVRLLLARTDRDVVNVDKLSYAGSRATVDAIGRSERHAFVHADVCDGPAMRALFETHRPAAVVHLAAESHVDRSIDRPADFIRSNVVGTCTLLDAALGHWRSLDGAERDRFRFLHVSTDEVYGSLDAHARAFREADRYAPSSPYAASKAGSDHLVRAWHHTYGLPTLVSNCSNNYGPYQFPEKLIPLAIGKAMAGAPIPIYGTGRNVRDWLYVEDHALALLEILDRGRVGEQYNVGGNCERTNVELIGELCALLDELRPGDPVVPHSKLVTHVADRPGHDLRYAMDASKIERELGWRAATRLDDGLRRTVQWYGANRAWCRDVTQGSYAGERLGLAR